MPYALRWRAPGKYLKLQQSKGHQKNACASRGLPTNYSAKFHRTQPFTEDHNKKHARGTYQTGSRGAVGCPNISGTLYHDFLGHRGERNSRAEYEGLRSGFKRNSQSIVKIVPQPLGSVVQRCGSLQSPWCLGGIPSLTFFLSHKKISFPSITLRTFILRLPLASQRANECAIVSSIHRPMTYVHMDDGLCKLTGAAVAYLSLSESLCQPP